MQAIIAYAAFLIMVVSAVHTAAVPKEGTLFFDHPMVDAPRMQDAIDTMNREWAKDGEQYRLLSGRMTYRTTDDGKVTSAYGGFVMGCSDGSRTSSEIVLSGSPETDGSPQSAAGLAGFTVLPPIDALAEIRKAPRLQVSIAQVVEGVLIASCRITPHAATYVAMSLWMSRGAKKVFVMPVTEDNFKRFR